MSDGLLGGTAALTFACKDFQAGYEAGKKAADATAKCGSAATDDACKTC